MIRLNKRKFLKKNTQTNKVEITETESGLEKESTLDKNNKIYSSVLTIYCLYDFDNNKSIDEVIPKIVLDFKSYGKIKLYVFKEIENDTKDSLFTWKIKSINWYQTDNLNIFFKKEEFSSLKLEDNSLILVDNQEDLDRYHKELNYSFYVKTVEDSDKIVIEKKRDYYTIFNPYFLTVDEVIKTYDYLTIAKQSEIKKMFTYKFDNLVSILKDRYKYSKNESLLDTMNVMKYIKLSKKDSEELVEKFNQIKSDQELKNYFIDFNKILLKQYQYCYLIN